MLSIKHTGLWSCSNGVNPFVMVTKLKLPLNREQRTGTVHLWMLLLFSNKSTQRHHLQVISVIYNNYIYTIQTSVITYICLKDVQSYRITAGAHAGLCFRPALQHLIQGLLEDLHYLINWIRCLSTGLKRKTSPTRMRLDTPAGSIFHIIEALTRLKQSKLSQKGRF